MPENKDPNKQSLINDKFMIERITPENINSLAENEVFVFGSNLSGRHGKGAAKIRLLSATADSFLLPEPIKMATNSASLKALLPLSIIFSRGLSSSDQWVIGKLVASKC